MPSSAKLLGFCPWPKRLAKFARPPKNFRKPFKILKTIVASLIALKSFFQPAIPNPQKLFNTCQLKAIFNKSTYLCGNKKFVRWKTGVNLFKYQSYGIN
jgi:hypothetical protein